jgi:uncharacterized membrane protein
MSSYTFLLFVHIASAVAWVGGGLMAQFFGLRALRAGPERVGVLALDISWIATRLLVPSSLLALVSGILLVVEGPWSFGDTWITIELLLLFLIIFDMAVKPDFGDAGALEFGLGAAALAVGIILWRWPSGASPISSPAGN